MIKIAIADDEALFRKGMILILEEHEDMETVLEAENGDVLLKKLEHKEILPDILLLDLNMPKLNGIETAKILREKYPSIKIIILSTYFSKAYIINMIEVGAAAYLPKNTSPEEVEGTIRYVWKTGFCYNQKVLEIIRENMIRKTKPKIDPHFGVTLTEREKEILQLICEEYTTPDIAKKLFISPRTVEGHRNNLLQKLGCRNVAGLVIYAIQNELVSIHPDQFWVRRPPGNTG